MRTVIINGANGFVASNFISELLRLHYNVVALVRADDNESARKRMLNSLAKISGIDTYEIEKLRVLNYALFETNFGIQTEILKDLFDSDIAYFHFAASLKFSEKSKEEIFATNIDGLNNSIKTFLNFATNQSQFFYISTAYSCGKIQEVFEEKFYPNQKISAFRNYYEQSKRFAENLVKSYMESHRLKAHIIRPSQVVGNNTTGITKTDFGIFDFTKRIYNLSSRYPNETIRIKANANATQNLIPVNTLVRYLILLLSGKELPVIINCVSKTPVLNCDIINSIAKIINVNLVPVTHLERDSMTAIERIVEIGMSFTGKYSNTHTQFDTTNLEKITNITEGSLSTNDLQKMLDYFVESLSAEKKAYKLERIN
ncbi:MAG: SDR family oxidoreductase [Salinivirgaceae bacterium]